MNLAALLFGPSPTAYEVYRGEPCFGCLEHSGRLAWLSVAPQRIALCARHLEQLKAAIPAAEEPKRKL